MQSKNTSDNATFRPLVWILALAFLGLLVVWLWPEVQRQQRYLRGGAVLVTTMCSVLVWMIGFSRLRWPIRLSALGLIIVAVLTARFGLKIRGVNGDLLPIVEPRWREHVPLPAPAVNRATNQAASVSSAVGEFPQIYGPLRNGTIQKLELETDWQAFPPKVLWRQSVGAAWSGFAVKGGLAVTLEQRGESEYVIAYEVLSGRAVWTHADIARYSTTIAGEGARTTPTIVGDRVFTFGGTGILNCLELQTGKLLWSKDAAKENSAGIPEWGFAGSPLVVDEQVIISVGGSPGRAVASYSLQDGQLLWANGEGGADFSSPMEATFLGTRQVLVFAASIVGRDLKGTELWAYPWPGGHPHVTPPLAISTNLLFASSGYGTGCELIRLDRDQNGKWSAAREWKSMSLKSKFGPLFRVGDYIYGLDDGILCCVELKTGQRKWKDGRYGHGQGLLVGEHLLLSTEKGEIALVKTNPERLVEVARFKVFEDKTWNPPALAGEYLLVRNDKEAACLQLKTKKGLENI